MAARRQRSPSGSACHEQSSTVKGIQDLRQFRSTSIATDSSARCSAHELHQRPVVTGARLEVMEGGRGEGGGEWGHGLRAQAVMVISCSHQARMVVIKSQQRPVGMVRQEAVQSKEQRTQGRTTDIAGRQRKAGEGWDTLTSIPGHTCIVCVVCIVCIVCIVTGSVPRNPLDVIAMSSSGILAASPNVCSCSCPRLFALACILTQIASKAATTASGCCRDPPLATIGGRALLRDDDSDDGARTAAGLISSPCQPRKAFSLADALQRAAFAALSKW